MKVSRVLIDNLLDGGFYHDPYRCSGRSTGIALACIGAAMRSPGIPVTCRDHRDSVIADKMLLTTIKQILDRLGLNYFTVYQHNNTIKYDPFVDLN